MWAKILEWVKRYLPAELFGTAGAVAGAGIVFMYTHNHVLSAYSGVLTETLFYFLFMLIREHWVDFLYFKRKKRVYGPKGILRTWEKLAFEFGFSGTLSFFVVRPFFLLMFPIWIGKFVLGTVLGKVVSDIFFYSITISFYELRKKVFK